MIRIYLYKIGLLLFGAALIAIGIITVVQGQLILNYAVIISGVVISVHGVHNLLNYVTKKGERREKLRNSWLVGGFINLVAGIVLMLFHGITIDLFYCWIAVYTLFNALIKAIDFGITVRESLAASLVNLVGCLFFLCFGIIMIFMPDIGSRGFLIVAGVYCIAYGAGQINDFITSVIPQRAKNKLKRRLRVTAPAFVATFMPYGFLVRYSGFLNEALEEPIQYTKEMTEKDDGLPPDIEVFIHVSDNGVGKFGHCDLCYNGEILSYGNYDEKSYKMKRGLGDGIFFTAERKRYIRFSVTHDKKTMLCYGLRLTPEQLAAVDKEIREIRSKTIPWKPPYQLEREKSKQAVINDGYDYCSKLWNGTRADFYKFTDGKFKTYFVMSANCVMLADSIIGQAGADIIKIDGVMTPGTYFDYLQREYLLENSMVFKRTVYNKYNCEEQLELDQMCYDNTKGRNWTNAK